MSTGVAGLSLPTRGRRTPVESLLWRVAIAVGLLVFVTLVAYADRHGYRDAAGDEVSLLDAFYYSTVSVTTTGYGDVIPVTDRARLLTAVLITPARILFLIVLVSTTLEVLAESSRTAFRTRRWRKNLRDHVIVCGYGTKGRSAIEILIGHGRDRSSILVLDQHPDRIAEANEAGYAAMQGDAARAAALVTAGIEEAAAIIVAPDRDDTAVLIALTAREHNPDIKIIAAVREEENRHLLHQSGADSVITSSGAAGRLLGFAAMSPTVVEVLEDLLTVGSGLDVQERPVTGEQVGKQLSQIPATAPVIAVLRGERLLRFDDEAIGALQADDRLVCLCSHPDRGRAG